MFEIFHVYPWFLVALAAVVGLCVGSFCNVVIHRLPVRWDRQLFESVIDWADMAAKQPELGMPRVPPAEYDGLKPRLDSMAGLLRQIKGYLPNETVVRPRSRCPSCGHGITALENIPVASWIALRGKCSACRNPISLRYPLIEAGSGIIAGAIAWKFGPSVQGAAALLLFFWLLALAMIDADTAYLSNESTLPLLWIGLLLNVFKVFSPLPEAVAGAVVGYLFLALPAFTFEWLRKLDTPAMGRGDFVLMALVGAWFGWTAILPVVLLASCVGLAVWLPALLLGKADALTRVPFGPYIAGAAIAYLFFGTWLKDYLGLVF